MSDNKAFNTGRGSSVPPAQARITALALNPLDLRRLDLSIDLTPCLEPLSIEAVIVGPGGDELSSMAQVHVREWALDRVMHLRRDAEPGEHTLHVGLFHEGKLVHHLERAFVFRVPGPQDAGETAHTSVGLP